MLHAISWSVFLMTLLCLALVYWLFIGIFYYSMELKQMIAGKSTTKSKTQNVSNSSLFLGADESFGTGHNGSAASKEGLNPEKVAEDIKNTALFPVAYRLVDELKETINESAAKKSAKEELFFALQIILGKDSYSGLKSTPFKVAINNLIESECLSKAGFNLKTEELSMLWKR